MWVVERKFASNWLGGRYIPASSICLKYDPYLFVSEFAAESKSFTGLSLKKSVNIEPIWLMVWGMDFSVRISDIPLQSFSVLRLSLV